MKIKVLLLLGTLVVAILTGCTPTTEPAPAAPIVEDKTDTTAEEKTDTTAEEETDAVTTASIVDSESAFEKAIGKEGTWIIATLKDLTFDKELVLEGEFKNGKKNDDGTEAIQRKIALYTQDGDRKVTDRFSLTVPKLTIMSPNASIQHGNFKGDLYVETNDFKLVDTKVDGNIYFTSEESKAGFEMDAESSINGTQEVKN